jgi:cellulose synthase/poly-beta-1,6-N-acetylglucosamine synthase-like glycosyltransferase
MNTETMRILFYASLAVIAYVYFGYPLVLWLGTLIHRGSIDYGRAQQPFVSIIVAAHNEESCIEEKLRNVLALDYPRDRVEILIGSDGSSDRTEEIVRGFASEAVGLVSLPQQHGKSAMQNSLASHASGELLVFTDADCLLPSAALSHLTAHFADPRVGLVSACPRYRNASETVVGCNEGIYLRYETWLRRRESDLGLLAMASGSLFAMRRSLWRPLAPHFGDDFVLPLRVIRARMLNRVDPRVVAATNLSQNRPSSMLRMKSRIVSKDFRALLAHRDLLNPFRYGATSVALWSHKLLRWLIPYFLIALLATNACLLADPHFRAAFALQLAFYAAALVGFCLRDRRTRILWSVPMSFCLVNFAALVGTAKALAGRTSGLWQPERNPPYAPHFRSAAPSRVIK